MMRTGGRLLVWLVLFGTAMCPQSAPLPTFKQYAVPDEFHGKPAAPVLRTANQRQFRTMIREGAAKGPNFAGHYTIVDWGCGAGCVSMVVVDAKDGTVFDGPFQSLSWAAYTYEGKIPSNMPEFEPLDFSTSSRMLIARGCPQDQNCASYFYEWVAPNFKLVRRVEAKPIPQ